MKLWLDDIRPCPDGDTHARSVNEAIKLLDEDDCGTPASTTTWAILPRMAGDGYRLVLWMAEHDHWPSQGIRIHSANPPGMARMLADIDRYGPYPRGNGISRGDPQGSG
jgi:hypothetical protein